MLHNIVRNAYTVLNQQRFDDTIDVDDDLVHDYVIMIYTSAPSGAPTGVPNQT